MEVQRPLAVWQCCTRAAQWWIPIGATWVDYIPEVNVMIETNARQGIWQFDILFPTNDTVYNFNLFSMTQRNSKSKVERPLRRCLVPAASRL